MLNFIPALIAHRGASAYAPENTLISFVKAVQMGVKWIEFDVMQVSTGELVIFHDENLARTTNGLGELACYPYSYLQTLDAGSWFNPIFSGERIPSLQHILPFLSDTNLSVNIEIKAPDGQEEKLVTCLIKEMASYMSSAAHHVLFSSFSIKALQILRQYLPHALIGMLIHEWEPDWYSICQSLQCISLHINHQVLTQERVSLIKAKKKILLTYTVNDKSQAEQLFLWGVDAIFSDKPDLLRESPEFGVCCCR